MDNYKIENNIFINNLPELIDILDTIKPVQPISLFTLLNNNSVCEEDFIESVLHIMKEYVDIYPTSISEPDFHENMIEYTIENLEVQFEDEDDE